MDYAKNKVAGIENNYLKIVNSCVKCPLMR